MSHMSSGKTTLDKITLHTVDSENKQDYNTSKNYMGELALSLLSCYARNADNS